MDSCVCMYSKLTNFETTLALSELSLEIKSLVLGSRLQQMLWVALLFQSVKYSTTTTTTTRTTKFLYISHNILQYLLDIPKTF